MPSERVQARIEQLLAEAEAGQDAGNWEVVRRRCEAVLDLDPENAAALEYLEAMRRWQVRTHGFATGDPARPGAQTVSERPPEPAAPAVPQPQKKGHWYTSIGCLVLYGIVGLIVVVSIIAAAVGGGGAENPSSPSDTNGSDDGDKEKPTDSPAGFTFGSGKKQVGQEVVAGATYRTREGRNACYWARLRGLGGTLEDIIENDNTSGPAVVSIGADDVGFESARCGTWTQDLSPITSDPNAPFKGEGTYIVNVDISPGTWQSSGASTCYWERQSSFGGGGKIDRIIANANSQGDTIVTIDATDVGFKSARCGTWTKQ